MAHELPPVCDHCQVRLSVSHILVECPTYSVPLIPERQPRLLRLLPRSPPPPISFSPSPPLPECSHSSVVAAPLDSAPFSFSSACFTDVGCGGSGCGGRLGVCPLCRAYCSVFSVGPFYFPWFLGATSSHYAFSSVKGYVG